MIQLPMPRLAAAAGLVVLALTGCSTPLAPQAAAPPAAMPMAAVPAPAFNLMAIRAVGKHKGDHLPAHKFKLEIDGLIAGGFKEATGLKTEIEVIEYRDGDDPITHKRAGKAKYKNITLKRGFVNDASLLEWFEQGVAGAVTRKSGSIIYIGGDGQELRTWFEAWPCRWKAPELNSHANFHAVEEIEFVVEKVERARVVGPGAGTVTEIIE